MGEVIRIVERFPRVLVGEWVDVEGHDDAWGALGAVVLGGAIHG